MAADAMSQVIVDGKVIFKTEVVEAVRSRVGVEDVDRLGRQIQYDPNMFWCFFTVLRWCHFNLSWW
jgi:uncharacterized membrane protein